MLLLLFSEKFDERTLIRSSNKESVFVKLLHDEVLNYESRNGVRKPLTASHDRKLDRKRSKDDRRLFDRASAAAARHLSPDGRDRPSPDGWRLSPDERKLSRSERKLSHTPDLLFVGPRKPSYETVDTRRHGRGGRSFGRREEGEEAAAAAPEEAEVRRPRKLSHNERVSRTSVESGSSGECAPSQPKKVPTRFGSPVPRAPSANLLRLSSYQNGSPPAAMSKSSGTPRPRGPSRLGSSGYVSMSKSTGALGPVIPDPDYDDPKDDFEAEETAAGRQRRAAAGGRRRGSPRSHTIDRAGRRSGDGGDVWHNANRYRGGGEEERPARRSSASPRERMEDSPRASKSPPPQASRCSPPNREKVIPTKTLKEALKNRPPVSEFIREITRMSEEDRRRQRERKSMMEEEEEEREEGGDIEDEAQKIYREILEVDIV